MERRRSKGNLRPDAAQSESFAFGLDVLARPARVGGNDIQTVGLEHARSRAKEA
jgi:hypothetical protein